MPPRLPPWLRVKMSTASNIHHTRNRHYHKGLHTVCREAHCPNQAQCVKSGCATFLILGNVCTRNCAFCAVTHGIPREINYDEPFLVAAAAHYMKLKHAVLTSVTRDDLLDGGAAMYAATVEALRATAQDVTVELLIPDFHGDVAALERVLASRPDVLNHNLETAPRLYPLVRMGASYSRSLKLLREARLRNPLLPTKTGLMLGMGEKPEEIIQVFKDIVGVGCSALTLGQYLQPSTLHHQVQRFLSQAEFDELAEVARSIGIKYVQAGPLVRSSFRAGELAREILNTRSAQ